MVPGGGASTADGAGAATPTPSPWALVPLRTFHGDPEVAALARARTVAHRDADLLEAGAEVSDG
jgi:hypothetical protein